MKTNFKKVIAVLCAIALVVTSMTVYSASTTQASSSGTGNGKVYTVTDGAVDGFDGFTCNGVNILSEVDGYIGFAWGIEVDPASIKVTIDSEEVATYNAVNHGVFVSYSEFKSLEDGEYAIVVTATTQTGDKAVTGNATLKIEDQGETQPAITDPEKVDWDSIAWLGNGTTTQSNLDRFKAYVPSDNPKTLEVVNVQTKNDIDALYMPNQDSPADQVEVNGTDITADCVIDGAQTFVPVTALTAQQYNIIKIITVNKIELKAFIYNKTVEGEEPEETTSETTVEETTSETTVEETTSETTVEETTSETTVEETTSDTTVEETTSDTTVEETTSETVPEAITMDQELPAPQEDNNYEVGGYTVYVGGWNGSTAIAGVDANDSDHIKVQQKTSNWNDAWGLQIIKKFSGLTAGADYTIEWKIVSESTDGKIKVTNNDADISLTGGEQTLTGTFTADGDGNGQFVVGMGWIGVTNPVEFFAPTVKDTEGNVVYPTDEDETEDVTTGEVVTDETTAAPTTAAPTTATPTTVAPTTAKPTTAAPTTAVPKTTKKKVLSKTMVRKATKKKASKKVSITFKKVTGAKKYQVQISTTKKFKKVLVRKTVKKVKITITNKKLRNKKKLYVRVKAVGAKKWSKVKKITIKK